VTLNNLEQSNDRRRALSLRELSFLCKSQWHIDKLSVWRRALKRPKRVNQFVFRRCPLCNI